MEIVVNATLNILGSVFEALEISQTFWMRIENLYQTNKLFPLINHQNSLIFAVAFPCTR